MSVLLGSFTALHLQNCKHTKPCMYKHSDQAFPSQFHFLVVFVILSRIHTVITNLIDKVLNSL